jgi:hypothetical protein
MRNGVTKRSEVAKKNESNRLKRRNGSAKRRKRNSHNQ